MGRNHHVQKDAKPTIISAPESKRFNRLEGQVADLHSRLETLIDIATKDGKGKQPETSDHIANKLTGVMKDLDGLKQQMVSLSMDDNLHQSTSSLSAQGNSTFKLSLSGIDPSSKHLDSSFSTAPSGTNDHLMTKIQAMVREEVAKQFDSYRDMYLTPLLVETISKIEDKVIDVARRELAHHLDALGNTQSQMPASYEDSEYLGDSFLDAETSSKAQALYQKFLEGEQEKMDKKLLSVSGRSTPRGRSQSVESIGEKKVRWNDRRAGTPGSFVSREAKDAELLLQKLREKISKRSKVPEKKDLKKNNNFIINPPSRSLVKPTLSSQLKNKAYS
jgi:hypothetical protein